jgi:hypothetical protein
LETPLERLPSGRSLGRLESSPGRDTAQIYLGC